MSVSSRILIAGLISALLSLAAARGGEPANPNAGEKTRAVLRYFQGLEARPDKKIVSGQFTNFGRGASERDCELAFKETGRWPAMIGLDYAEFSTGGLACEPVNRVAIDYARKGGLVTISAHLYNPANPRGGGLRDKGVDLAELVDPGSKSESHARWMKELDILAAGLKELEDAGVVVLWRPFHEVNGDWFWWGGKDPAVFIRLWRQMFDRFTKDKKLNNLLWVYSPNHGRKTADYYAGDAYVDLVGLDAYTDFVDPQHIRGYTEIAALPKPFGFTEFGPHGPQNPPGDYDYRRFLAGVEAHFPRTSFFLSWHNKWGLGRNPHARELLDHPWIVNREDLPRELLPR
jgi:mannan endo-1,4-beta-mannosidase